MECRLGQQAHDQAEIVAGDVHEPGFPIWIRPTCPKMAETLAKPRIPSFTRRVRQDWLPGSP